MYFIFKSKPKTQEKIANHTREIQSSTKLFFYRNSCIVSPSVGTLNTTPIVLRFNVVEFSWLSACVPFYLGFLIIKSLIIVIFHQPIFTANLISFSFPLCSLFCWFFLSVFLLSIPLFIFFGILVFVVFLAAAATTDTHKHSHQDDSSNHPHSNDQRLKVHPTYSPASLRERT